MTTTIKTLTDSQIRTTQSLAGQAADYVQAAICDLALNGTFDRDDWTTLSAKEADRVAKMTREEAYATIVAAINIDEA